MGRKRTSPSVRLSDPHARPSTADVVKVRYGWKADIISERVAVTEGVVWSELKARPKPELRRLPAKDGCVRAD